MPFVPNTDQCYLKITVSNCLFRANIPTVITRDAQTDNVTSVQTFPQSLLLVPLVTSGLPEECLEYNTSCFSICAEPQPICLPYRCGDVVQITVSSNLTISGETTDCSLSSVSPVLEDTMLAFRGNTTTDDSLIIDTSVIDPNSFNDPQLGLYFDPQPTRAQQLCNGGGDVQDTPRLGGSTAEFECSSNTAP